MSLEQWEIDLRKELEGRVSSGRPATEAPKHAESEYRPIIVAAEPKKKEKKSYTGIYVLVFFLALANLYIYNQKANNSVVAWLQDRIRTAPSAPVASQPTKPVLPPPAAKDHTADIAKLRSDLDAQKAEWEKLVAKVRWNGDRIVLLGMLHNENFLIVRNNADRRHLIFFNRDWTINSLPRYLQLTEEDKQYLQKYVKPGNLQKYVKPGN